MSEKYTEIAALFCYSNFFVRSFNQIPHFIVCLPHIYIPYYLTYIFDLYFLKINNGEEEENYENCCLKIYLLKLI